MADLTTREEQRGWRVGYLRAVPLALIVGCIVVIAVYWSNLGVGTSGMERMAASDANDRAPVKASGPATLKTEQIANYGTVLTDDSGHPLYLFEGDKKADGQDKIVSTCYDDCAKAWPPLLSSGKPQTADGVKGDLVGTQSRRSGSEQVTYNGWPLYRYAMDVGPDKAVGQDVKDFGDEWYLVNPAGEKVEAKSKGS